MNKKKFKGKEYFSSLFSTEVKLFKSERSKELMASLTKLADFLPSDINYEENIDLVPIAFDAFIANRRNKNNQVIGTKKALEIVNNFKYKFIDIEHNRENLIGVILTTGFTSFGENSKPLTLEEVQDMDEPFNVVCGGVIWPVVDEEIVSRIEESSNELSKIYKKISASWELLSSDLEIAVFDKNEKNLMNATIDKDRVYEEYLVSRGGSGKTKDGKIICDLVAGDTLPVGMGLTTNPAAEVEGVLAGQNLIATGDITTGNVWASSIVSKEDFNLLRKDFDTLKEILSKNMQKTSNLEQNKYKNSVKDNKENIAAMDIKDIKEITDENLKDLKASDLHTIHNMVVEDLKKKSEEYVAQKKEQEAKAKEQEAKAIEAQKKLDEQLAFIEEQKTQLESFKTKIEDLEKKVQAFEAAESERVAEENFNNRMEILSSAFEVNKDARKVIAKKLQSIESDEQFEEYKTELSAYLSVKASASNDESDDISDDAAKSVVASALEKGNKANQAVVNSGEGTTSKSEKWAKAAEGIKFE